SGAQSWQLASAFSSPSGTLNHFTAAPGPDGVKRPKWVQKSETSGERASVTAAGAHYRLVREVRFAPRRVLVEDRITNVTDHDMGVLVRHEVSLQNKAEALVRIAGRPVLDEEFRYSAPANPSVHVGLNGRALGMICDDDVLSNQAVLFHDGKRQAAGFDTDKFLV